MRDVNGKVILPGQRVRRSKVAEAEGVVQPNGEWGKTDDGYHFCLTLDDYTIEVLEAPRIPEPEGLGAVVEASVSEGGHRHLAVRVAPLNVRDLRWWIAGYGRVPWGDLFDPVLKAEGWTDDNA